MSKAVLIKVSRSKVLALCGDKVDYAPNGELHIYSDSKLIAVFKDSEWRSFVHVESEDQAKQTGVFLVEDPAA